MAEAGRGHGRGLLWKEEEVQCLLNIWADEHIAQMLDTTHKNTEVYTIFSERMRESGFVRSVEQCRAKAKKLRQQYIKIRDLLNKSGSAGDLKEKFPWYDELDQILGKKPVVEPVDLVESFSASFEVESEDGSSAATTEVSEPEAPEALDPEPSATTPSAQSPSTLPIPGARARKRKARSEMSELLQHFQEMQRRDQELNAEAEQARQAQEATALENMIRVQQEAEERRFQAMQAQHTASQQMFMQMMGTLVRALHQPPHSYNQFPNPTPIQPPMMPAPPQHYPPPQQQMFPPQPFSQPPHHTHSTSGHKTSRSPNLAGWAINLLMSHHYCMM